jgi:hypothetical protein
MSEQCKGQEDFIWRECTLISTHICPLNLQAKKIRRNLKLRNPEDPNPNQIKIHPEQKRNKKNTLV